MKRYNNNACVVDNVANMGCVNNAEATIRRKRCGSVHIKRNGNKHNKQRYYCKDCKKTFSESDNRIKRDLKQRELALILYINNSSLRSIQRVLECFFDTKISMRLIEKWNKSFTKLLNYDIHRQKQSNQINKPPETIEVLELDELRSYFYNLKKNEENISKYGLLLIGTKTKLLHIR
jgi:transposase-like protein